MRHGIAGNRLARYSSWRKATVRDIAKATLVHQRVCTTLAKAKEARKLVEQLITLGKKGELIHRRRAFSILSDHQLVQDLFNKTSPRFKSRQGGYTRIIPLAEKRRGDRAQLVYLELTEKDRIIISKVKSEKPVKAKAPQVTEGKVVSEPAKTPPPVTETKPEAPKAKLPTPGHEEKAIKQKIKTSKGVIGGIKQFFRKKPSE